MNDVNDHGTNGIAAMMTLTNGNAAVIIDNWRRDHEFVIIASSFRILEDDIVRPGIVGSVELGLGLVTSLGLWLRVMVSVSISTGVTSLVYRRNSHFRCYCGGIYRRKSIVPVVNNRHHNEANKIEQAIRRRHLNC